MGEKPRLIVRRLTDRLLLLCVPRRPQNRSYTTRASYQDTLSCLCPGLIPIGNKFKFFHHKKKKKRQRKECATPENFFFSLSQKRIDGVVDVPFKDISIKHGRMSGTTSYNRDGTKNKFGKETRISEEKRKKNSARLQQKWWRLESTIDCVCPF